MDVSQFKALLYGKKKNLKINYCDICVLERALARYLQVLPNDKEESAKDRAEEIHRVKRLSKKLENAEDVIGEEGGEFILFEDRLSFILKQKFR